jgi:hypothetical protein
VLLTPAEKMKLDLFRSKLTAIDPSCNIEVAFLPNNKQFAQESMLYRKQRPFTKQAGTVGTWGRIMKRIMSLLVALFLSGCAFPASKEGMIVTDYNVQKPTGDKIFVRESTGGSTTLPFFKSKIPNDNFTEAVKTSLLYSKAFSELLSAWGDEWGLEINIKNVDQPMFGLDYTVTTTIQYSLFLRNEKVFETEVHESGTATIDDSFLGVIRLKLANENSARANIKKFLQQLSDRESSKDQEIINNESSTNKRGHGDAQRDSP